MGDDINGLHHVGHIVRDLGEAMERYRQLGFAVGTPAYPVLQGLSGGAAEPVGVANAHVYFPGDFVELVAVVDAGRMPGAARPIPLRVPDDKLAGLAAAVRATAANIVTFLDRFQGVHIVIADTSDIDGLAARLTAAGVGHGGVHAIQRPVETPTGITMEPARYVEISAPGLPGSVPEGRIGFAQNAPVAVPDRHPAHPNGATGLIGCVLCVDDQALPDLTHRYSTYFGRPWDDFRQTAGAPGGTRGDLGPVVGDLGGARDDLGRAAGGLVVRFRRAGVTVVGASALDGLLPGERPAGLPGFVAYAVSVRDLDATERLLRGNGVPVVGSGPGEVFVPADAALGVAVVFRQDG
ncbi:VOC family protein [Nonomuraea harbinensis]|uniref:VOC family protein n=1 Tax=Nonomuraea harbinensis TaxID=1286938 RepID=A0ABW1BXG8_9ACTN|nr:VOC family protein [Nonomuraea harbinensis]